MSKATTVQNGHDDNIHIIPTDELDSHAESEACQCGPMWDLENKREYQLAMTNTKLFVHKRKTVNLQ